MIRKYRSDDLDGVLKVWSAASAKAHPFLSPEFLAAERDDIAKHHLPAADTWVWDIDGQIAGFVALLGQEVGGLFVDPRLHGRGIGRALMDHARRVKGALQVEVFMDNTSGRSFYAQYGFVEVGRDIHPATGLEVLRLEMIGPPGDELAGA